MLVCRNCFNTKHFTQVSERHDARDVQQTGAGTKIGSWNREDTRSPGLYCPDCGDSVEPDEDLPLTDDRLNFVRPEDFNGDAFAEELVRTGNYETAWTRLELPAQEAKLASLPGNLHSDVATALARRGIERIYTHQAESIEAALARQNVVQATPAGSGKSLGFIVPVLQYLTIDPEATAILVFPMRALVNDQLNSLLRYGIDDDPWVNPSSFDLRLTADSKPIRVARRDGSTLMGYEAEARKSARILITTPDSLHHAILRYGRHTYRDRTSWTRLFRGLSVVVLDEIHSYQGVFGSAVGQVLRRLRRHAVALRAEPQFLAASATIGNPVELAERLTGVKPFTLVDNDGSARERRILLVGNPPPRDATKAKTTDPDTHVGRIAPQTIAIDLVCGAALASDEHDPIRTIGFSQSRNAVFSLAKRIKNRLTDMHRKDLASGVAPYAGTLLAEDRSNEEERLRDGSTLAIVSTNALELGIDIPDLSFAMLEGYPGRLASFRQRIGRVGRAGEGVAALIVGDDPLQQYIARDPDALSGLLSSKPEDVVVNPEAEEIVSRFGLAPGQAEFGGIAFEDAEYFGREAVERWLAGARGAPTASHRGRDYFSIELDVEPYGSIRSATSRRQFTVYRAERRDKIAIGTLDEACGPRDAFVPAVWSGPDGDLYRVTDYTLDPPEILCEGPLELSYQTRGVVVDRVDIERDYRNPLPVGRGSVGYGSLSISRQVVAYKEQHFSGTEKTKELVKGWPPVQFVTDGLYLELDLAWWADLDDPDGAIRAFEHVLVSAAPVVVSCDPYDLDVASDRQRVYLYDSFGGGMRLSETVFDRLKEVLETGCEIIATCPCTSGCPGCVMLSRRPDGNAGLSKSGALTILERAAEALTNQRGRTRPVVQVASTVTGTGPRDAASVELEVGAQIAGRFEVKEHVGSGGFSTVYRVWDQQAGESRALKVFGTAASRDDAQRELSTLRQIPPHPNVVQVFWKNQLESGNWFLVEEFVEGTPLRDFITGSTVSDIDIPSLAIQLLDALVAIHPADEIARGETPDFDTRQLERLRQSGFVHRDVKPENIIVTPDSVLKLLDFNIATRVGDLVDTMSITRGYTPPDPVRSHWDTSPDLFAAGVVLYELVCGAHPWERELPLSDIPPTDPREHRPHLAADWRTFLLKACAPDRDNRFATAHEMRAAVGDLGPVEVD